jgi:DNA-directed RNA polymerase subunit omega
METSRQKSGEIMLEELKSNKIVNKVGGRFKLAALIQKRMDELLQGSRPLIEDATGKTMLEIVVQEILQDKIAIDGVPLDDNSQKGDSEQAGKIKSND